MSGPQFRNLEAYVLPKWRNIQLTFSTGSSSAYAVWHILEANGGLSPNWEIVFTNTGFERWESLAFLDDFERETGAPITRLERRDGNSFEVVGHNSISRNGEPFWSLVTEQIWRRDGTFGMRPLPSDGPRRLCSGELKTKTAHRYLRSKGWRRYSSVIGFRADEGGRVERRKKQDAKRPRGIVEGGVGIFPLFDAGVTAEDVYAFWEDIPWRLAIPSWRGNCTNCFMMSEWKMKERMALDIESVEPWIAMEEMPRDRNNRFRPGMKSMRQLRDEVAAGDMSVSPRALRRRPECGSCHD